MQRTAAETREHVLRVAHDLFYWHGIRATGIDRVAAEAGVAPTTLYRLFDSKDGLIAAYVERADRLYRQAFDTAVEKAGSDPRERILAVFDEDLVQWSPHIRVQEYECRGCTFLMTLAEFPDPELPAHRNAVAAKQWIRSRFNELVKDLAGVVPVKDPEALADQLVLILEGMSASAQSLRASGPAMQARSLARIAIDAAVR